LWVFLDAGAIEWETVGLWPTSATTTGPQQHHHEQLLAGGSLQDDAHTHKQLLVWWDPSVSPGRTAAPWPTSGRKRAPVTHSSTILPMARNQEAIGPTQTKILPYDSPLWFDMIWTNDLHFYATYKPLLSFEQWPEPNWGAISQCQYADGIEHCVPAAMVKASY
jgi:hypothetical protein